MDWKMISVLLPDMLIISLIFPCRKPWIDEHEVTFKCKRLFNRNFCRSLIVAQGTIGSNRRHYIMALCAIPTCTIGGDGGFGVKGGMRSITHVRQLRHGARGSRGYRNCGVFPPKQHAPAADYSDYLRTSSFSTMETLEAKRNDCQELISLLQIEHFRH